MVGGVIVGLGWILGSTATSPMMLMISVRRYRRHWCGHSLQLSYHHRSQWFPDKRGLAVGLTLLGFGFSAFITGKLSDILSASFGGVFASMKILGIAFLILIVVLSMFLVFPPAGWMPAGWKPPVAAAGGKKTDFMRDEMSKTTIILWPLDLLRHRCTGWPHGHRSCQARRPGSSSIMPGIAEARHICSTDLTNSDFALCLLQRHRQAALRHA